MKVAEIDARGLSLSRMGWLGRVQADPSEDGAGTWKDEPTDREERETEWEQAA